MNSRINMILKQADETALKMNYGIYDEQTIRNKKMKIVLIISCLF